MDFNQVVLKVDHQVTNKDQFSGRYFIDHFDNAAIMTPGDLLSYRTGTPKSRVRSQSGVYAWKKTLTATLLTETHVGFQRMHAGRVTPPTPSLQELGIRLPLYPTTPNLQSISVDGFFSVVCTATAASHAEASAFLTPADDNGSMNDPASPTRSQPLPAYSRAR